MAANDGPDPVLVVSGPIAPSDIPALCARARALWEGGAAEVIVCDVGALEDPDACAVDALARLQLTARRLGRRILFRDACGGLRDLFGLMGLGEVLPCGPPSGVGPKG